MSIFSWEVLRKKENSFGIKILGKSLSEIDNTLPKK